MKKPQIKITENCVAKGCCNKSVWYPVVSCWAMGFSKFDSEPLTCEVGMGFCDEHKGEFELCDIPDLDKLFINLCKAMKKAFPDTSTMEFEMKRISS